MQSFAASFGIAFGCPQVPILDNLAVTSADSATSLNHPLIPRHCRCSPYVCLQVFPRDLLLDFKVHLCTPTLPVRRSLCSISPSGPVSPSAWGRLDGFGNPHRPPSYAAVALDTAAQRDMGEEGTDGRGVLLRLCVSLAASCKLCF